MAALEPARWLVVDATRTLESIQETVRDVVIERLSSLCSLRSQADEREDQRR
jgi:thymidylate kinase